jgi:hypothetical protein
MLTSVSAECVAECGVRVRGRIDTATREFIHRFELPAGADALLAEAPTEIDGSHLATFSPEAAEWRVECPLCRKSILIGLPPADPAQRSS